MASPLPVVPAPWSLTGKGWTFVIHTPFSKEPIALPAGAYSPLEQGSSADQSAHFHGGVGVVMLVRYEESDAGPYDELIYVPGYFANKLGSSSADGKSLDDFHLSITRIYVSTAASVVNGRRNWGIPKHLAKFDFTPSKAGSTYPLSVNVSLPNTSKRFFSGILTQSAFSPSVPVKTSWLDFSISRILMKGFKFELIQPALPASSASNSFELDGEQDALVASEKAYLVKPTASGWSKLTTLSPSHEGTLAEYGNGVDFPCFKPVMGGRGTGLTFSMAFPVPEA